MYTFARIALLALAAAAPAGCTSTGIAIREGVFGQAKREQLVDRVEDVRDEQAEAKEQFATTLEEFQALTSFDGGNLESLYKKLDGELKRAKAEADDVRNKIESVESVAGKLFDEWERELDQYTDASLRSASADQLRQTQTRYGELVGAMRRAEATMDPVLAAFNNQVLFLKHNLNAQAIASLGNTVGELESQIARLIADMNASIAEADAFIAEMGLRS